MRRRHAAAARPPTPPLPSPAELPQFLRRARHARARLVPPGCTILRLVHDEADGMPGLQVDRFGPLAVVQAYDSAWRPHLDAVARALVDDEIRAVRAVVRGRAGRADGDELWVGEDLPEELGADEPPLTFRVRPRDESLSVGLFPDARLARRAVAALARGRRVLNLFAYTGGFTVAALWGGAVHVDQVDLGARVAPWAARNVTVNGLSPRACRFVVEDAVAFTARAARSTRRYGMVVLDPPTFARAGGGWHHTADLHALLVDALTACDADAHLMFSTNTVGQDPADLWSQVQAAAREAARAVVLEQVIRAGADFPVSPGGDNLARFKMLQVRVS
ncbi:MAG: class I SAM-dependent methyltransferase [Deltaproteobacteria bacterium]|nr:class I SAM-dependent methyltransferase [Deltaproteobacteria bacterium]